MRRLTMTFKANWGTNVKLVMGVGGACLVLCGSASAATFCVGSPSGCSGTTEPSIAQALSDSNSSPGDNTIEIAGGHTYAEDGLLDLSTDPVSMVGVGSTPPVITATTPTAPILDVRATGTTLSNLNIQLPAGWTGYPGLLIEGKVNTAGIAVSQAGTAGNGAVGVQLAYPNAALSNATVSLPGTPAVTTFGVELSANNTSVSDSTLTATEAVYASSVSNVTVSRVQAIAPFGVTLNDSTGALVQDSVLNVQGALMPGQAGDAVDSQSSTQATSVTLNHVTAYNNMSASGYAGIQAYSTGGFSSSVNVSNSVIQGFEFDLSEVGTMASVVTDYNDWHSSNAGAGAPPVTRGAHDLDVLGGFVNPAGGDFHLTAASQLIDKATPTMVPGESTTDVYGADRFVAGLGTCSPQIPDIGAAEYQSVPVAAISAPANAVVGNAVSFGGTNSCSPDANSPIVSYAWSFDDGGSASGATVRHAFSIPGTHTVTLKITTMAGATASKTAAVHVSPASSGGGKPPTILSLAISPSKLGKGGATVTYTLSEAASVRFVVEALMAGRRGAHGSCVALTNHNRRAKPCLRTVVKPGAFTLLGASGANHFTLGRSLGGKRLAIGRYELVGTPSAGGRSGSALSARFVV
jgi:hypothetical protein